LLDALDGTRENLLSRVTPPKETKMQVSRDVGNRAELRQANARIRQLAPVQPL